MAAREKSRLRADDKRDPASEHSGMPIVQCPRCGIRQYAAASYVAEPRCVRCDAPLGRPKPAPRPGGGRRLAAPRRLAKDGDTR